MSQHFLPQRTVDTLTFHESRVAQSPSSDGVTARTDLKPEQD